VTSPVARCRGGQPSTAYPPKEPSKRSWELFQGLLYNGQPRDGTDHIRVDNTKSKSQGRNAALDQVDRNTISSELINARWGRRLD